MTKKDLEIEGWKKRYDQLFQTFQTQKRECSIPCEVFENATEHLEKDSHMPTPVPENNLDDIIPSKESKETNEKDESMRETDAVANRNDAEGNQDISNSIKYPYSGIANIG